MGTCSGIYRVGDILQLLSVAFSLVNSAFSLKGRAQRLAEHCFGTREMCNLDFE